MYMDWNNDGKVDFQDHALFNNEISNGGGGSSGGGGGETGCLTYVLIGLIVFQVIKWIAEAIY